MGTGDQSDHFMPSLAHFTGLILGWVFVDIVAHLIGAHPREGNKMSTTEMETPPPPTWRSETEEEYTERIRAAIRRGDEAYRQGRVHTHEEAMRRLSRWLGD
jgi:hypothetical protein